MAQLGFSPLTQDGNRGLIRIDVSPSPTNEEKKKPKNQRQLEVL
jgi:hypothetical protein